MSSDRNPSYTTVIYILAGTALVLAALLFSRFMAQRDHRPPMASRTTVAKTPSKKSPLPVGTRGKIAIVLDDWGYNKSHCRYLKEFNAPVAPAILPNLPFSQDILQCALSSGQAPMLHLPLEPHVYHENYPRSYILTTWMAPNEVTKLLRQILDEYPGIVGVNNHMGSKGTEERELMTTILKELKSRRLFFVDSVTSGRSVCPQIAKEVGLPFARRAIFLDNRNERTAIEQQFATGARIARERGSALIIGHDRALTLQIVAEQIKKLKAQGYEIVSIKDFIKAQTP